MPVNWKKTLDENRFHCSIVFTSLYFIFTLYHSSTSVYEIAANVAVLENNSLNAFKTLFTVDA